MMQTHQETGLLVDMDDPSWAEYADSNWVEYVDSKWVVRPSLYEIQLEGALELGFQLGAGRVRQTDTLHPVITGAIASMVPANEVTNLELARILWGKAEQDIRAVRNFRNALRPLRFQLAGLYIERLLHSKRVAPSEGGRLWYSVLLYSAGRDVAADYLRATGLRHPAQSKTEVQAMTECAKVRFDHILRTSLERSSKLPVAGYPMNGIRQFMDYCAFIHWQESKVQRNPIVGIKRLIELAPIFDAHSFDD
jgi:hypothetical protein